jgi:hypothetical protein
MTDLIRVLIVAWGFSGKFLATACWPKVFGCPCYTNYLISNVELFSVSALCIYNNEGMVRPHSLFAADLIVSDPTYGSIRFVGSFS